MVVFDFKGNFLCVQQTPPTAHYETFYAVDFFLYNSNPIMITQCFKHLCMHGSIWPHSHRRPHIRFYGKRRRRSVHNKS